MRTSTPPCRAMSVDAALYQRIRAAIKLTPREFEIMEKLVLRNQNGDETAMSRRAFIHGTGLLLGFALVGASTEPVFAAAASQVIDEEVTGAFAPNGFIRINPTGVADS